MTWRDRLLVLHLQGLRLGTSLAQAVQGQLRDLQDALLQAAQRTAVWDLPRWLRAGAAVGLGVVLGQLIADGYAALQTWMHEHSGRVARRQAGGLVAAALATPEVAELRGVQDQAALTTALAQTPFPSASHGNQPSAAAADWWTRQGVQLAQGVTDQLRASVQADEPVDGFVQRLRGTRARRGNDGLMAKAMRSAAAVVLAQTAMALTQGTEAIVQANPQAGGWLEHVSILDERTTIICQERDGKRFDPLTHAPLGHRLPYLAGPPYHFGCRSTMILMLAGAQAPGTPVAGNVARWLTTLTPPEQRAVLGSRLWQQWRTGVVPGPALLQALLHRPVPAEERP